MSNNDKLLNEFFGTINSSNLTEIIQALVDDLKKSECLKCEIAIDRIQDTNMFLCKKCGGFWNEQELRNIAYYKDYLETPPKTLVAYAKDSLV